MGGRRQDERRMLLQATLYGPITFLLVATIVLAAIFVFSSFEALRISLLPPEMQMMKATEKRLESEDKHERIFARWKKKYNRSYTDEENQKRFKIFRENYVQIKEQNKRYKKSHASFRLNANKFADVSDKEFKRVSVHEGLRQMLTCCQHQLGFTCLGDLAQWLRRKGRACQHRNVSLPEHIWKTGKVDHIVDHRDKGAVTAVQDQGHCGSCWSFATVGAVEGAWAKAGRPMVPLSVEELVQCDKMMLNSGCDGGVMQYSFEWIIRNGGIASAETFPYISGKLPEKYHWDEQERESWFFDMLYFKLLFRLLRAIGQTLVDLFVPVRPAADAVRDDGTCKTRAKLARNVTIRDYCNIDYRDMLGLEQAVVLQPVAVAVQAQQMSFRFYHGGIISSSNCENRIDHGLLLVGYGYDHIRQKHFWLLKNSWGEDWGENGYVRLEKIADVSTCGIGDAASYPVV